MAAEQTTLVYLVFVCVLAGVSHGGEATCSMKQADVFSKLIACVTKSHPEYYLVILTKVNDLESMEKPDFMCSEQNMMTDVSKCLLEYIRGCMPASVASQVGQVMPTRATIQQGIKFLCDHRKDFDDKCVTGRLPRVGECITSKMQTFSRVTRSTRPQSHMHNALCYALKQEEQCLDQSLAGCPQDKVSNIKKALVTFFPSKSCLNSLLNPQVLQFQSEGNRRH